MRAEHFDAVIVGSGFGGAVTAYRLAEAGLRVCVLERGKAYPPHAFARDPHGFYASLWDPSEGLHGLFDIWSFRHIEAVVSSGLGGGSLIYANVMLRKDPASFVRDDAERTKWPVSYRDLEEHYDAVEKMLGAIEYPLASRTPKTVALQRAAKELGLPFQPAKLAVTFANGTEPPTRGGPIYAAYPNYHGVTRYTCRLCGECDIGCQYGSKNTLDYTYLSAAKNNGADIRPRHEVRQFEPISLPEGRGYAVHYVDHSRAVEGRPRDTRALPLETVTCDHLVLASGALGSTYLLLKNRDRFRSLSPALGSSFSGNGDVLGFARECHEGPPDARRPYPMNPSDGPVITGMIHVSDADAGGRGFYVQDGGYPAFAQFLVQATQVRQLLLRSVRFAVRYAAGLLGLDTDSNLGAELSALIGESLLSSTSLTLLGIGRDVADGRVYLSRSPFRSRYSELQIDWTPERSRAYYARVRETMEKVSTALGGRFLPNVLSYLHRLVTVHPLGGCPMGDGRDDGVVNQYGEVFEYPGLFVVDGAAMPAAVGANPSLTIAAYAHRCAERMIASHHERHPARRPTALQVVAS